MAKRKAKKKAGGAAGGGAGGASDSDASSDDEMAGYDDVAAQNKIATKAVSKLTDFKDFATFKIQFLVMLGIIAQPALDIVDGNLTPTRRAMAGSTEPMAGSTESEDVPEEDLVEHAMYYKNKNKGLYALLVSHLGGTKMSAVVKQTTRFDGHALWNAIKSRSERGGKARKRTRISEFFRSRMLSDESIEQWTERLGNMRTTLTNQHSYVVSDEDIIGHALQGLKPIYRPARKGAKKGVLWEEFVTDLHEQCDAIDLDANADAAEEHFLQRKGYAAEAAAAAPKVETRKLCDLSIEERIRKLQAELEKLRQENASAEETATVAEEQTDNHTEEKTSNRAEETDGTTEAGGAPLNAGLVFSFED